MNSYSVYRHYFQSWARAHVAMRDFVTGDVDRIMNKERSSMSYPVLWLETPEVTIGAGKTIWRGAWVIMKNVVADDYAAADAANDVTFRLAEDLLQRMRDDNVLAKPLFKIDGDPTLQNISTFTHDNDYGWRCEFTLVVHQYKCLPAFYHHNWGPFVLSLFRWTHDSLQALYDNVTIENLSLPDSKDILYTWIFIQEGEDPMYSQDRTPPPYTNLDSSNILKVVLLIQTVDALFSNESTAYIPNGQRSYGYSSPDPLLISDFAE